MLQSLHTGRPAPGDQRLEGVRQPLPLSWGPLTEYPPLSTQKDAWLGCLRIHEKDPLQAGYMVMTLSMSPLHVMT